MVKISDLNQYLKSTKIKLLVCSKFSKSGSVGKIGHNGFGLGEEAEFEKLNCQ